MNSTKAAMPEGPRNTGNTAPLGDRNRDRQKIRAAAYFPEFRLQLVTEPRELVLRKFGLLMAFVLTLLLNFSVIKSGESKALLQLTLAAGIGFFAGFALLAPSVLSPLEKLWMKFGEVLAVIISRVIVFLFFYTVITPFAFLLRLFGKELLLRKFEPEKQSYFVEVEAEPDLDRYKQPF